MTVASAHAPVAAIERLRAGHRLVLRAIGVRVGMSDENEWQLPPGLLVALDEHLAQPDHSGRWLIAYTDTLVHPLPSPLSKLLVLGRVRRVGPDTVQIALTGGRAGPVAIETRSVLAGRPAPGGSDSEYFKALADLWPSGVRPHPHFASWSAVAALAAARGDARPPGR